MPSTADKYNTNFTGYDHVTFYVSNAVQAASYYCTRLGFKPLCYQGLETGSREICSQVVEQDNIRFVFKSSLMPNISEINDFINVHGDGVKDVAFEVDNCKLVYQLAVEKGARSVSKPKTIKDEDGEVTLASIATYGDVVHTFVQRNKYNGIFLPGYKETNIVDPLINKLDNVGLNYVDHCVGNQPDNQMDIACDYYEKVLGFYRFWSVDDKQIHTEYSSLRSVVMANPNKKIKMPINEPAEGKRKSQIKEYVEHNGGSGVQHIALNTNNIINAVKNLNERGCRFLSIPNSYYDNLKIRLKNSKTKIKECIDELQKLNILVDFDDNGYLLQLFTKPVQDRPTFFIEIIQRYNHEGFGAGNFKALFESIERDQLERGNL